MILTDGQIKAEVGLGRLIITPFSEASVNPSSYDVRLGKDFSIVKPRYVHIDPTNPLSFLTEKIDEGTHILKAGAMVLSTLEEEISLPRDISAKLLGRSSLGRLGIDNSSCSGWIDPGWAGGTIVIELFNHSKNDILLTSGMGIGQIVFYKHMPCQESYSEKKKSKYQNQTGVQGSKGVS